MHMIRSALAGLLALLTATAAVAQQFPTIPSQSVIGRLGVAGSSGPSQAIPFATLFAQPVVGTRGALTGDGAQFTVQNTSKTATSIYSPLVPPGWFFFDTVRSTVDLESGTTVTNGNAFGAYVYNNVAAGSGANAKSGVGYFSEVVAAVNGASVWGANFSCVDNSTNGLATLIGRTCVGLELDFTANGASNFAGMSLIMQGPGTPLGANALQVGIAAGSTALWSNGLVTNDGALTSSGSAIMVGAKATSGASVPSQTIKQNYFDAGGVEHALSLQASLGGLNVTSSSVAYGVSIATDNGGNPSILAIANGAGTTANLNLQALGAANVVSKSPFAIGVGAAITSSGPGGALGSNAFTSTAYAPIASPTFTGTVTVPNGAVFGAFTLGGNISGGGFGIDNAVIGGATPAAGAFTTLTGSTSATLSSYTPTLSSAGGNFASTVTSGKYWRLGNVVCVSVTATAGTIGAASGVVTITLPTNAQATATFAGRENGVTGKMFQAYTPSVPSNTLSVVDFTNGSLAAASASFIFSGCYLSQ